VFIALPKSPHRMSGIAGIIHFDGAPVATGLIEGMTSAMAYRGPDGIRHWQRGSVALGQCMLRTTPESLEETQPLANEDESLVLVIDGRVDNWEELRRELLSHGTVLRNRSDAELVLRAFETWGRDCLDHIDGDFALAIWDARRQQLFCARDRIGNKPFFYHWDGTTLVIASELHPILALPWVTEALNEDMLAEFIAWEFHSTDETVWAGILRLVEAHCMVVGNSAPHPEKYWQPDLWETLPFTTDQDYIDHYRELLADTVRRLSRSHRPVAVEVSGGLDSSAVFCAAEHLRRSGHLPAPAISGYTLAFPNDLQANEIAYARAVGEHLGLPIHEIDPSHLPLSWFADRARNERQFPGFPNTAMFEGMRQQIHKAGSRVVLTGEGGDEYLGGTRLYYAEELAQQQWSALRDSFRADVAAFGTSQAVGWFLRYGILPSLPSAIEDGIYRIARKLRGTAARDPYWLTPGMRDAILRRRKQSRRPRQRVRMAGQREMIRYDPFSDHVMQQIECMGAKSGLEMRYPLRTQGIVQFACSTPERLRLRGDRSKGIHVRALQDVLPRLLLERTCKADFGVMFRAQLDKMGENLTRTIPTRRPNWVTADGMGRLYQTYQDHREYHWPFWVLWGIHACDTIRT
jgi:asparagine synthase (glutamine-hydrolysing)